MLMEDATSNPETGRRRGYHLGPANPNNMRTKRILEGHLQMVSIPNKPKIANPAPPARPQFPAPVPVHPVW